MEMIINGLNKVKFLHKIASDDVSEETELAEIYPIKDKVVVEWVRSVKDKSTKRTADKILYYKLVWEHTNINAVKLANYNLRGFHKYHVDHIYPISRGFKEGILPSVIGGIDNLQMLPWRENFKKSARLIE